MKLRLNFLGGGGGGGVWIFSGTAHWDLQVFLDQEFHTEIFVGTV